MIQSIERAIDILEEVSKRGDWVGVREIARAVNLKVPTAQQILKTLQARNFLEFNEELRQYRPGFGLWLIAEKINPLSLLANKIKPHVDNVFNEIGETTVALALINSDVKVVDWRQSKHSLAVIVPDEEKIIKIPHQLAGGRIVLAFSEKHYLQSYMKTLRLPEKGENLFRSEKDFLTEIERIREEGYAQTENVLNSGITALAVPVFSETGAFIMALACSMPTGRFSEKKKEQILKVLKKTAEEIKNNIFHEDLNILEK
ncbi:MAG: hypothetical protein A2017_01040 [Lentisphaerae bacterium GWF2_44_16]|nr:MAG: hypothetical protein A2017_01040 [Lentisphaerae bacterium GWF2_44_16]